MATTKYGIKTDSSSKVEDISMFENGELPKGYLEITEKEYYQYLQSVTPYSKFNGSLLNEEAAKSDFIKQDNIRGLYKQLRSLHIEIGLQERMGNSTSDLVAQFNEIKNQYNILINGTRTT